MLAALSVATDFAMSASAQFGLRSAVLAVALARRMGWDVTAQRHVHLQALLRYIGCNVDTQLMAALVGDELAARRAFAGIDTTDKLAVVRLLVARMREAHQDVGRLRTLVATAHVLISAEREMAAQFAGHCEVGQRLATRLRLPAEVVVSLGQLYERWDGKGLPQRLRGAAVSPVALLVSLVQDVIVHHDRGGQGQALAMVRARRGGAHAPAMSDAFIAHAQALFEDLLAADAGALPPLPGGDEPMDDEAVDNACAAMADFADIKSPWTLNHSTAVAQRAAAAAKALRLSEDEQRLARRAGLLHDLGSVGISAGVWGKAAPLTRAEQEQVRLHAYYTDRILSVAPELQALADAAGAVHDRLDGSGYFRRPAAAALPRVARVLAAADVYQALREDRPHRKAYTPEAAARALLEEAAAGRLRAAGAIVLGKTNVAQGLVFAETDNPLFGRCNHPEDAERSPGGSSGGEGAIVAVGGSALGLGTDIGGSGRIPAAFCGIASIKPTAGRVPDTQRLSVPAGQQAIPSQIAPMARNVADVELALGVLNPPHLMLGRSVDVDMRRLRVGVFEHDGVFAPSPGVRRVVREAAGALKAAGAQIVPFTVPEPESVRRIFYGLLSADGIRGLKRTLRGGAIDARVKQLMIVAGLPAWLRRGAAAMAAAAGQRHLPALLHALGSTNADGYWGLVEQQLDYQTMFTAAMDRPNGGGAALDLLLSPVMPVPAFRHRATLDLGVPGIYTSLYNLLGWPAGVVPCGRVGSGEESNRVAGKDIAERAAAATEAGSAGLPLAVQVAARPWHEHEALAAMRTIEVALPKTR